jgi:hypothetical protein
LAKSAICPGIITVIWSLITSNTTGDAEDEEPDDEVIEFLNKPRPKQGNYLLSFGAEPG